jgi:hypothetical protein
MGAKNATGLDVKRPNRAVKIVDRMSRFHLGSRHFCAADAIASDCRKSNAIGKLASVPTLLIPFRETAGKLLFCPTNDKTPQPPCPFLMTPA